MSTRSKTTQQQTPQSAPPPSSIDSPASTAPKRKQLKTTHQTPQSAPPTPKTKSPGVTAQNKNKFSGDGEFYLTLAAFEERLNKQTDMIINRITDELSKTRCELFAKLEQAENNWFEKLNQVNTTIAEIVNRVECIEANSANTINLHSKLDTTNTTIADVVRRVDLIEGYSSDMRELNSKLLSLEQQIDATEKKEIAADAVMFGVPCLPDENLTLLFNRLCLTAKCKPPTLKNIFRSRSRNPKSPASPPVIIKFASMQERNSLLKCITLYRKQQQNHQLSLRDLGIESDNACFLNESLSKNTRTLLHHAIRMRNNHQLFSAYTKHGSVFIKLTADGESFAVYNVGCLEAAATTSN